MKKAILWTITALAIIGILVVGATTELTVPAVILAAVCLAWLGIMAAANWRKEK